MARAVRAMALDLLEGPWPAGPYESVFTANTAHIVPEAAPGACCCCMAPSDGPIGRSAQQCGL